MAVRQTLWFIYIWARGSRKGCELFTVCVTLQLTFIIVSGLLLCLLRVSTEFIEGVSQFSVKGDKLSKLRCEYSRHLLYTFTVVARSRKGIRHEKN